MKNRYGFDEDKLPEKTIDQWVHERAKLPFDKRFEWDQVPFSGVPRGVWLIGIVVLLAGCADIAGIPPWTGASASGAGGSGGSSGSMKVEGPSVTANSSSTQATTASVTTTTTSGQTTTSASSSMGQCSSGGQVCTGSVEIDCTGGIAPSHAGCQDSGMKVNGGAEAWCCPS